MNGRSNPGAIVLVLLVSGTPLALHAHSRQVHQPAAKPLELRVTPRATQSPGTIRVTASMQRHQDNRQITVEAESGGFLRSSSSSLEGADAPKTYTRVFTGLPPGTYEVTATLERSDGTELNEVVMVEVIGGR
jgi:uncharacterized protein (DUF2141 family)